MTDSQAAGKWGDYRNCDMSPRTFEGMLKNLSQFDFEFILFTGTTSILQFSVCLERIAPLFPLYNTRGRVICRILSCREENQAMTLSETQYPYIVY